jgi:hypothetical protein
MEYHPMYAGLQPPVLTKVKLPDGRINVGEPAALYMRSVEADREVFAQLGRIRSFAPAIVPDSYSLAQWQTPVRDQSDRGTCYVFACVAAMEAMYCRTFGLSLDLSEQYAAQLSKIGELYPTYMTDTVPHESNTTYWGGQGNSGFLNVICRCAVPLEEEAPYLNQEDLEKIRVDLGLPAMDDGNTVTQETIDTFEFCEQNVPTAARSQATYLGTGYTPINFATPDIENAIASNHEVVLDIETFWSQDANGVYQYDSTVADVQGHCVLVVGYDRGAGIFTFKNSWGGISLDQMSYDCLTHIACGATTLNGVVSPGGPQILSRWLGNWNSDHDGWRGKLTIRRVTNFRDGTATNPTKLGDWYAPDNGRRDINGSFSENGLQSNYWMAPDANKVQPGQPVGQPFNVENYSWESTRGAGTTIWNNTTFGVILDRAAIPGSQGTSAQNDWIGSWAMDHDGWQGTLTITGFNTIEFPFGELTTVQASYTAANGTVSAVTGTLDPNDQQHLFLTIAFAGNEQPFSVYRFSWETDNAAGNTAWSGTAFGVRLHKNA